MLKLTAAVMASLLTAAAATCSICAADTPVKVSVSDGTAGAGSSYTVYISLEDIPTNGIASMDFAVEYDNSLITVDKVTSLVTDKVGADSELLSTSAQSGALNVCWITSGNDTLKTAGRAFAVTGRVLSKSDPGAKAKIDIVPVKRQLYKGASGANSKVKLAGVSGGFDAVCTGGYVTAVKKFDVNADGMVDGDDAAVVLKHVMQDKAIERPYCAPAADCTAEYGVVDIKDAIWILNNISYGGTALDISKTGLNQCTYTNGVLHASDVALFSVSMPDSVKAGDTVRIYIRAKDNGGTGFRCWLTNSSGGTCSDGNGTSAEDILSPGASGGSFVITRKATDTANAVLIKGPSYNTNIADLDIEYIGIENITDTAE
ncbi:MAG: hypothetical protein IKS17_01985 [Firmicutes bacterium]|nr:hypothetical protein [Bacillota bacterium]